MFFLSSWKLQILWSLRNLLLKELVHFNGDTHKVQQTNGQKKRNQSGFTKTYRNGCNLRARSIALALQICLHIFWCNFKYSHWNNKHSSLDQCKLPFDFEATFKINGNTKKQARLTLSCFISESGALPFYKAAVSYLALTMGQGHETSRVCMHNPQQRLS